jgi:hypothetical protein
MNNDLFGDHRDIVAISEELLAAARRLPRPDAAELSEIRARLGRRAANHLRAEDETIIQPLLASGRLRELPGAEAAISAIRASRVRYSDHVHKWTLPAVVADWDGYAADLAGMIAYLKQVLAQEERDLYWPALRLLSAERRPAD